jgi:hypothetical protein
MQEKIKNQSTCFPEDTVSSSSFIVTDVLVTRCLAMARLLRRRGQYLSSHVTVSMYAYIRWFIIDMYFVFTACLRAVQGYVY